MAVLSPQIFDKKWKRNLELNQLFLSQRFHEIGIVKLHRGA
jgi:hypothetical protein